MEYISDVFAAIALLVSGYAIYQSHGINKRQKPLIESQEKINQILLEKDKLDNVVARKAAISAEYVLGGSDDCLKIWNSGISTTPLLNKIF